VRAARESSSRSCCSSPAQMLRSRSTRPEAQAPRSPSPVLCPTPRRRARTLLALKRFFRNRGFKIRLPQQKIKGLPPWHTPCWYARPTSPLTIRTRGTPASQAGA
jgi:hypothetical protein